MKTRKIIVSFVLVLLVASFIQAQRPAYYISVARCDAGQITKQGWQQTANKLKRGGIPVFFANMPSLGIAKQTRGDWLLVRMSQRYSSAHVDALELGPFASKAAARTAVSKIAQLLPNEWGSSLIEDHDHEWTFGCYLMLGTRTK